MPDVTLSDAVDVICRAGSTKMNKVAQIKNRPPYHPSLDFYRPLRSALIALHIEGNDRKALDKILAKITDAKKIGSYDQVIEGYRKWWGYKKIEWFDPPKSSYEHAGVVVKVNPELGLIVNGQRYIIKLYLKDEQLHKIRIDPATVLMEIALRSIAQSSDLVAILDVRKAKLHTLGSNIARSKPMVDAELSYIAALWPNV
ncbi:hypothetical protein BCF11_3323 [Collimonas sp. PA-H2]|nr:hypothetical protein BCF11_3323 [Collimonas sp. PA-H2]